MACLRPQRIVHLVAVAFAVCGTLVRASYYLDDRDSSITYVGDFWGPALILPPSDVTKLYNGTAMSATCFTKNGCTMTIPFNGTGMTLYVMLAFALSFNASIDGGTPTYHHFDGVFGCCNSTIQPLFNFTVYNITSLPLGNHALRLTLLDTSGYSPVVSGRSLFDPDYVFVDSPNNEKPTASIGPLSSTKPTSRLISGAIGGTFAGITAISIAIFILLSMRRRTRGKDPIAISDANILTSNVNRTPTIRASHSPSSISIDPDPNILVSNVNQIPTVGAHRLGSKDTPPSFRAESLPNPVIEQRHQPHGTSASPNSHTSQSASTVPPTSALPVSTLPSGENTFTIDGTIPTASGSNSASDSALAAEEARFLRRLYDRNAPADEIAELLRSMRVREEANSGMVASSMRAGNAGSLAHDG